MREIAGSGVGARSLPGSFCPSHLRGPSFKAGMALLQRRTRDYRESSNYRRKRAGCICRALRRLRSEREASEAFRYGGGRGVRKRICKTVWPKGMRGNERKGFRSHKGKLYMRVICLVCMAGTRATLKSSVSIIIKREATNYVSSLGS